MTPLASFVAGTCTGFVLCIIYGWWLTRRDVKADDPTGKENVGE